jgi:hypothetical protein
MNVQPGRSGWFVKRIVVAALCVSAAGVTVGLEASPAAAEPPETTAVNCARELDLSAYWSQKARFAQDFLFSDAAVNHYWDVAEKHLDRWIKAGC